MIPRKLAETVCRRFWLLLLPIVAVPLIAVLISSPENDYQSKAVVWVTSPLDGAPLLGTYNPFLSPAQNQANGLNDMLGSETFRMRVALDAGVAEQEEGERPKEKSPFKIWSFPSGTNTLTIVGQTGSAEEAQKLVTATIDRFGEAAREQSTREAGLGEEYYRQQLEVAQRDLDARRADVAAYLAANPGAAVPGSAAALNIDYQTLQRAVERQAGTVSDLQSRLQAVELRHVSAQESYEVSFVVQDEPNRPDGPLPVSLTSRFAVPLVGVFLGLLISCTYVYLVYRTDHSLVSGEDVAALGAPVLAEIPSLHAFPQFAGLQPLAWLIERRYRHFARHTATYVSTDQPGGKTA